MTDFTKSIKPTFVSIGSECTMARILRTMEKRDVAYPFDWLETEISTLPLLFKNKFSDFLNKENIKVMYKKNWYKKSTESQKPNEEIPYFMDTKYITFHHHDGIFDNEVYDKYKRRCDRLVNLLETRKNIILFRYKSDLFLEEKQKKNLLNWINTNKNENAEIKKYKLHERLNENISNDYILLF